MSRHANATLSQPMLANSVLAVDPIELSRQYNNEIELQWAVKLVGDELPLGCSAGGVLVARESLVLHQLYKIKRRRNLI